MRSHDDFTDGIVIIKSIALLCDVHTPMMDNIIFWYQKMINKVYFIDSKTFGKDIVECNCPQNYGISNLVDFTKLLYIVYVSINSIVGFIT